MSAKLWPRLTPPTVKLCMRESKTAEDIIGQNLATVDRALWAMGHRPISFSKYAVGMSLLMIGNRFVAGKGSTLAMQFFVAVFAALFLILATAALHFSGIDRFAVHWPHWSVLARCALVACSASGAHWLIYLGTTRAGAATVAPMTYVQLLIATLFGWLFFDNHPDFSTLAGAAIIIAAGLYLWRAGRVRDVAGTD